MRLPIFSPLTMNVTRYRSANIPSRQFVRHPWYRSSASICYTGLLRESNHISAFSWILDFSLYCYLSNCAPVFSCLRKSANWMFSILLAAFTYSMLLIRIVFIKESNTCMRLYVNNSTTVAIINISYQYEKLKSQEVLLVEFYHQKKYWSFPYLIIHAKLDVLVNLYYFVDFTIVCKLLFLYCIFYMALVLFLWP